MIFLILIFAFLLTVAGTGVIRDYALSKGIVDRPGHRSSHIEPTPRGGGLAAVLVFLGMSVVVFALSQPAPSALTLSGAAIVFFTAGGAALVGWIDDHRFLSPLTRIVAHFLLAAPCIMYFGVPQIPLGPWMIDLGWLGIPLATAAVVWCLNLFNFMDGIDGIAAVEAVTSLVGASVVFLVAAPEHTLIPYLWLLAVVSSGFLIWNWPPARIFMGDAASGFLGILLAQFALISCVTSETTGVNVWCWLILLSVFLVDASVTLILRMVSSENLLHAHRQHAYQRLARGLQRVDGTVLSPRMSRANAHRSIVLAVAGINLFWLTPLAVLATLWPQAGAAVTAIAMAPLLASVLLTAKHIKAA